MPKSSRNRGRSRVRAPPILGSREAAAFVVVDWDAIADGAALVEWVDRAISFVETLG